MGCGKSQVSRMAADLDETVAAFRHRPLDEARPFTFVAADALRMKVREAGRVINAVCLVATGVNGDGHREVLGLQVATSKTRSAWSALFADLVARGLSGVRLVTPDAHAGLVEAIAANLPGAVWQRCRTHDAANLMSVTPKALWPVVKSMLHSVYGQPDAVSVHAQFERLLEYTSDKLPAVAAHLKAAREDLLAFTTFPKDVRTRETGRTTPPSGSTSRSAGAPTRSGSSLTARPSPAWSERCSPSRPMGGPKGGVTSGSRSWPAAGSPPCPRPALKRCANPSLSLSEEGNRYTTSRDLTDCSQERIRNRSSPPRHATALRGVGLDAETGLSRPEPRFVRDLLRVASHLWAPERRVASEP